MHTVSSQKESIFRLIMKYESENKKIAAIIYMLLCSITFSVSNLCVKLMPGVSPFQVIYISNLIGVMLGMTILYDPQYPLITEDSQTNKLLFIRGFSGGLGLTLYIHSIYFLPLSVAITLLMLSPLWVGIISMLYYKESYSVTQWILTFTSFIGLFMLAKPTNILNDEKISGNFFIGILMGTVGGIIGGYVFLTINQLKNRTNTVIIALYFNFFNILISTIGQMYAGINYIDKKEGIILVIMGILQFISHILRNRALFLEKAFLISIVAYFQLVCGCFFDVYILNIEMDMITLGGCLIIVVSIILLVYYTNKSPKK